MPAEFWPTWSPIGGRRPLRKYATETLLEAPVARDLTDDIARRRALIKALGELSPKERGVVVMRHYLDLPEADVARDLKLSRSAMKSLNARSLAKLRARMDAAKPTTRNPEQLSRTGRSLS